MQLQTVPYLIDNPELGYVQARWVFANPEESYLTKVCGQHALPRRHRPACLALVRQLPKQRVRMPCIAAVT